MATKRNPAGVADLRPYLPNIWPNSPADQPSPAEQPATLPLHGHSRFNQIAPFIDCCRETWRKRVKAGKAPQPVAMSPRCKSYPNAEMHRYFADPAGYQARPVAAQPVEDNQA